MRRTLDSEKTIVVTGDLTIDWNLARRAPRGVRWDEWDPKLEARAYARLGGAALLAELVKAAVTRGHVDGPMPEVITMADAAHPITPDDKRFSHSYAVWRPCVAKPGERSCVWRVDPPIGLDRTQTDDRIRREWKHLAADFVRADVIVVDDANLGFRDHSDSELWRRVVETGRNRWVLLKASRPVAQGLLFDHLREYRAEKVVALMKIDDLRGPEVQISRELSWERTAQDVYWELIHNPLVNTLSHCAHVVVSFGAAGAILLSRPGPSEGQRAMQCHLLFDPEAMEGTWEAERQGAMIGSTACLAASLVRELSVSGGAPDLVAAINSGVAACRRLWDDGYGKADSGMDVTFPVTEVVDELVTTAGPLECVPVEDPSSERTPAAVDGDQPDAEANEPSQKRQSSHHEAQWTILAHRFDDLPDIAAKVALDGPDKALKGVPFGRFGELVTVDRGEIESLRSVQAVIAEYARSSGTKPLSIAVFGAPGSGKSFGIVQVAQSVDPARISRKIEFNLSQFTSIDDLHDAFHQVRDVGLEGKIPLVFWDEFDTSFQREKLGWLRYFLAPMQDGAFRQGEVVHPIGRAIFVFAGGTSKRMERFGKGNAKGFKTQKGPDFMSRLRGYVDILGPNPRKEAPDGSHVIRRAILLRSVLWRGYRRLFDDKDVLSIDPGVLRAFLETKSYRHSARSLESIVATSRLSGETSYHRSSLPSEAQLEMHVNGREFLSLVQRFDGQGD